MSGGQSFKGEVTQEHDIKYSLRTEWCGMSVGDVCVSVRTTGPLTGVLRIGPTVVRTLPQHTTNFNTIQRHNGVANSLNPL